MSIPEYKPMTEQDFRNAIRLLEENFSLRQSLPALPTRSGAIPLDVYEQGDNLMVKASLPGIKTEDVTIEVREKTLTIAGTMSQEMERREDSFFLNERQYGQFKRSITLPYEVKVDDAEAEYENGILTLTLPKIETTKGKKILLKSKV